LFGHRQYYLCFGHAAPLALREREVPQERHNKFPALSWKHSRGAGPWAPRWPLFPTHPAWLPVAKRPEGSMLLYHLDQHHLEAAGPYLRRMEVESIDRVLSELFARVEGEDIP
jgi:hypothetical protein